MRCGVQNWIAWNESRVKFRRADVYPTWARHTGSDTWSVAITELVIFSLNLLLGLTPSEVLVGEA